MTTNVCADRSNARADFAARTVPHFVEIESRRWLASGFVRRDRFVITADETLAARRQWHGCDGCPSWQSMRGGPIDAQHELELRFRYRSEESLTLS